MGHIFYICSYQRVLLGLEGSKGFADPWIGLNGRILDRSSIACRSHNLCQTVCLIDQLPMGSSGSASADADGVPLLFVASEAVAKPDGLQAAFLKQSVKRQNTAPENKGDHKKNYKSRKVAGQMEEKSPAVPSLSKI